MRDLWHTLFRINARRLSLGAVALLLLSMAALLPTYFSGNAAAPPATSAFDTGAATPANAVGRPQPREARSGQRNPFESAHLSELVALSDEGVLPWDRGGAAVPEPLPDVPFEESEPQPRSMRLMYHGMVTRTDGATVGLVEQGDGEGLRTYGTDEELRGWTVGQIARDRLRLHRGDAVIDLKRGDPSEVEY